jgi:hypothetical protein
MYYYLGSYVSGIFPQPYFFRYCRNKPDLICEINDWFYRTKYRIKYDSLMNIQWIEKSDTINPRLEILNIKIK